MPNDAEIIEAMARPHKGCTPDSVVTRIEFRRRPTLHRGGGMNSRLLTETSENRISYISYLDKRPRQVVYDHKGHCGACHKCLLSASGRCPCGGPYDASYQVNPMAWRTEGAG